MGVIMKIREQHACVVLDLPFSLKRVMTVSLQEVPEQTTLAVFCSAPWQKLDSVLSHSFVNNSLLFPPFPPPSKTLFIALRTVMVLPNI